MSLKEEVPVRKNKQPTPTWNRKKPYNIKTYLEWCYMYFCISFGLQMLDPWERGLFFTTITVLFAMSLYTAYAFLPSQIHAMLVYFGFLHGGDMENVS